MFVEMDKPKYYGSDAGKVIQAIAIDVALTVPEICAITGLPKGSLQRILTNLSREQIVEKKSDEKYWVNRSLCQEYRNYHEWQKGEERRNKLIGFVEKWKELKQLTGDSGVDHFFLDGRHLDSFIKDLIDHSENEVFVTNPYVQSCDLSDTLRDAAKRGRNVTLVTRHPEDKFPENLEAKRKYHKTLVENSVAIKYNDKIHSKVILVDQAVAIVASMNFYSGSSAGVSLESGLATTRSSVVESILAYASRILEAKGE